MWVTRTLDMWVTRMWVISKGGDDAPALRTTCRFGEVEYRWVSEDTWTYSTILSPEVLLPAASGAGRTGRGGDASAPPRLACPPGSALDLVLDGVDTLARVELGGRLLATTSNFHRCESRAVGLAACTACVGAG